METIFQRRKSARYKYNSASFRCRVELNIYSLSAVKSYNIYIFQTFCLTLIWFFWAGSSALEVLGEEASLDPRWRSASGLQFFWDQTFAFCVDIQGCRNNKVCGERLLAWSFPLLALLVHREDNMCRRRLDPGGFCVFFCAGTQRHNRCISRSDPDGFCNVFK